MDLLFINKTYFLDRVTSEGHRVVVAATPSEHCGPRPDSWSQTRVDLWYDEDQSVLDLLKNLPLGFHPDCIVYFDDSRAVLRLRDMEKVAVPTLFYSIDAHVHHNWHPQMSGAFDGVLVAQRDYTGIYAEYCRAADWLPLWAPSVVEPSRIRDIEVCFRGNLDPLQRQERVRFLNALAKQAPLDFKSGPYAEPYSRAKIVLNQAIANDVNFRVFEALSSGGMLLTPRCGNGLLELFEEGVHLRTYEGGDVEGAAALVRYYLAHPAEREKIAAAGRACVLTQHTESVRAQQFLTAIKGLRRSPRPREAYARMYSEAFRIVLFPGKEGALGRSASRLSEAIRDALAAGDRAVVEPSFMFFVELCIGTLVELGELLEAEKLALTVVGNSATKEASLLLLLFVLVTKGAFVEAHQVAGRIAPGAEQALIESLPRLIAQLRGTSFLRALRAAPV